MERNRGAAAERPTQNRYVRALDAITAPSFAGFRAACVAGKSAVGRPPLKTLLFEQPFLCKLHANFRGRAPDIVKDAAFPTEQGLGNDGSN
jgi:hypothetical protein